jgi:hypothetical protein
MELLEERLGARGHAASCGHQRQGSRRLAAKVEEARTLDASIVAKDAELESFRIQLESLAGSCRLPARGF